MNKVTLEVKVNDSLFGEREKVQFRLILERMYKNISKTADLEENVEVDITYKNGNTQNAVVSEEKVLSSEFSDSGSN